VALGEVRKIGLDADELKASIDASVVRVQLELVRCRDAYVPVWSKCSGR